MEIINGFIRYWPGLWAWAFGLMRNGPLPFWFIKIVMAFRRLIAIGQSIGSFVHKIAMAFRLLLYLRMMV